MKKAFIIAVLCVPLIIGSVSGAGTSAKASPLTGADFDVLQSAAVRPVYGVSGIAMVALFDGAPGDIYVSRTTAAPNFKNTNGSVPYLSSAIARVSGPDGRLAAIYDFSALESGKEEAVLHIPNGEPGIWTIQLMNGRNGDVFEIGINNTDIWGLRGEKVLGASGTLAKNGYIYTHDKACYLHVGSSHPSVFRLFDTEDNQIAISESTARAYLKQQMNTTNIETEKVYRLAFENSFLGEITIDGVPGLICPTVEAAQALKGGWQEVEGVTVQGPLQALARLELMRLAQGDLEVAINRPSKLPDVIENPMAQAQLFGAYGALSGLRAAIDRQILDTQSPYLGMTSSSSFTVPELNFQHGHYKEVTSGAAAAAGMANAATMQLQLNFAKGNHALIQRAAMGMLAAVVQLSEDSCFRYSNLSKTYVVMTGAMFTFEHLAAGYSLIRDYLDNETRGILDEAMLLICDKMGNYIGQGPTNQALFSLSLNLRMYKMFGIQRYHDTFKRQMSSILGHVSPQYGYMPTGYFMESGGCDGSYEYMNRYHFYVIYNLYKNLPQADAQLLDDIRNAVQEGLEFESFFWAPQPYDSEITMINPSCFTSRTNSVFGSDNYPAYSMMWHEFPLARRRVEMNKLNSKSLTTANTYPHIINTDEWALRHLKSFYTLYDRYFSSSGICTWPLETYEAFNAEDLCLPAETLPVETAGTMLWEREGFVAFKHKGIYGYSFYGVDSSTWHETKSFMGGGPTLLWGEGVGASVVSKKHLVDADIANEEDVISSCIYGTGADGQFICSGKEGTSYCGGLDEMVFYNTDEPTGFVIKGDIPDSGKTAAWIYELTDEGIDITAKISPLKSGEEFWVNLPIALQDTMLTAEFCDGCLITDYNGSKMIYSWDEAAQAVFLEKGESTSVGRLRIKIPVSGALKVSVKNVCNDILISEVGLYRYNATDMRMAESLKDDGREQAVMLRLKNASDEEKTIGIVCAEYSSSGNLCNINITDEHLSAGMAAIVKSDLTLDGAAGGTAKVFVWDSIAGLTPLTRQSVWHINE